MRDAQTFNPRSKSMGFINLFNAGDANMIKRKMAGGGNPRNFPHTKNYLADTGTAKVAAVFAAVSFVVIGVTGMLEFFFPENNGGGNKNGGRKRR